MSLTITAETNGSVQLYILTGSLDTNTAETLEPQVLTAIDAGARTVVFDLATLTYVSSVGLRVFLVTYRKLQTVGGQIRFCEVTPPVKKLFDLSGLSARWDFFPDRATALA